MSVEPAVESDRSNVFRRSGAVWTLRFAQREVAIKDILGMKYLAHLLSKPRCSIAAAVLAAVSSGRQGHRPLNGMELLDDAAVQAYRTRYDDLESDLAETVKHNDLARQE